MKKFSFLLVFVLSFGLLGNAVADINSGLVAHYKFDGNANDSSGKGNHGTENGGVSYTSGKSGQAASFDGVNDYIELTTNETLRVDYYTISFWIKTTSQDNRISIFGGRYGNNSVDHSGFNVTLGNEPHFNTIYSDVMTRPTGNWGAHANTSIRIGKWVYVTFVFDGQVSKVYVNGSFDNEFNSSGTQYSSVTVRWNTPYQNLLIGGSNYSNFTKYMGELDELRIYDRALSSTEIQELYTGNPSCTAEAATLSSNLDIHIPSLNYSTLLGTESIWADLEYLGTNSDGKHIWGLKGVGAN